MKTAAEAAKLPPKYTGKWARASQPEVDAALASGLKPVYRFRVPPNARVTIQDAIRGEVSWATDAVGDFVLIRSNGQPVYNFCVAVDDAAMRITHVLRAEEHLPNTLRQVLVYDALGVKPPRFGHVSLILAPDRSKLSKRHGATSVGEFRQQGYLPAAMVNFLALLGWNEGTTREIYSPQDLVSAFSLERITKSAAVFDQAKLSWVNGQHLRALPADQSAALLGDALVAAGLASAPVGPWVDAVVRLVGPGCELVADAPQQLRDVLAYALAAEAASEAAQPFVAPGGGFREVAAAVLEQHASGALAAAAAGGPDAWKAWVKLLGAATQRKGKGLFMPMRLALTGNLHGPDVGEQLALLAMAPAHMPQQGVAETAALDARMEQLRAFLAAQA
jgi:glutamyl-tRNA synthetase